MNAWSYSPYTPLPSVVHVLQYSQFTDLLYSETWLWLILSLIRPQHLTDCRLQSRRAQRTDQPLRMRSEKFPIWRLNYEGNYFSRKLRGMELHTPHPVFSKDKIEAHVTTKRILKFDFTQTYFVNHYVWVVRGYGQLVSTHFNML